jgi:cellulose synthase/poly-beta-1,6-N-acetylglucosamine synthase-like glycosyltransferase
MAAPSQSPINYQVAEFAWRVKNWARPLGLAALGLPCQLMGTGMAFPWDVIRTARLASGHIVEDLELGLELAAAGRAPLFCPSAVVTSEFPPSAKGAASQRQRWEHGHIAMILTAPALIIRAIVRGNWRLLALALDMAVPPLGLLGLLTVAAGAAAGLAAALGLSPVPLVISLVGLVSLAVAVLLSWLTFGRDVLPPAALLSLGPFVLGKLRLYGRLLARGPVSQWTRTDRK